MEHGIVKLPRSLSLGGNFFCKMALHSLVKATVSYSSIFFFRGCPSEISHSLAFVQEHLQKEY
jgi:hypothetical protein